MLMPINSAGLPDSNALSRVKIRKDMAKLELFY